MNRLPFFSVCIPTYNQSEFIQEAIEGVLAQTFSDYELIISDDSTSEFTRLKVAYYNDSRIKYYKHYPSLGRVENYKKCVKELASGMYIIICDGDDVLFDKNYLELIYENAINDPSIVFFQAGKRKGSSWETGEDCFPNISEDMLVLDGKRFLELFPRISHFAHGTTVSRLEVLKKVDPYSLDILSSDIHTYLQVALYGKVMLIKKPILFWRQHGANATSTTNVKIHVDNLKWIEDFFRKKDVQLFLDNSASLREAYKSYFYKWLFIGLLKEKWVRDSFFQLLKLGYISLQNHCFRYLIHRTGYIYCLAEKTKLRFLYRFAKKI